MTDSQNRIEINSEAKRCPMFGMGFECAGEECAWYIVSKKRCALWVLANSK